MNIAFAGLTAAGKTTHAKLLAHILGYKYVSATEIFLNILKLDASVDNVWFEHFEEVERLRQGYGVDIEVETRLQKLAANSDCLVLDTWAMAWISEAPVIGIWIESTRETRIWKCAVSQKVSNLSLIECASLIDDKDQSTRENFIERHGFDLFHDRERYHAVLDNSNAISGPTRHASLRGIRRFAPIVEGVARSLLTGTPLPEELISRPSYAGMIQRIGEETLASEG